MDHYVQQKKPSPVRALSKGVFDKLIAQQVAPVDLSKVIVCSSSCLCFSKGVFIKPIAQQVATVDLS